MVLLPQKSLMVLLILDLLPTVQPMDSYDDEIMIEDYKTHYSNECYAMNLATSPNRSCNLELKKIAMFRKRE